MREIKFRAWDVRGNRMLDIVGFVLSNNEIRIWYFAGESLVNESFKPSLLIILQFTGLHDKNGKEIYEGDVAGIEGDTFIIEFYAPSFRMKPNKIDGYVTPNSEMAENCELLGNIHENPELLNAH